MSDFHIVVFFFLYYYTLIVAFLTKQIQIQTSSRLSIILTAVFVCHQVIVTGTKLRTSLLD